MRQGFVGVPGKGALMHLPQYHPFNKTPGIGAQDLMNLFLILIGLLVTLVFYPWRQS